MLIDLKLELLTYFRVRGGLSLGFKKAGYKLICAVEKKQSAAQTYAKNFPFVEVIRT